MYKNVINWIYAANSEEPDQTAQVYMLALLALLYANDNALHDLCANR